MSTVLVCDAPKTRSLVRLAADFVELTKPKIAVLVLLTVGVGASAATWGNPNVWQLLHAVLGTALVAGSASALNQWLERNTDCRMERTRNRPLPAGRLSSAEVIGFATLLVVAGTVYLALAVNLATAVLGLLTWTFYVWIYTPLKSRTTLNTAVGAIPGALPAVMGWTAMGRPVSAEAGVLFLIVFLWQFPHFMAIAWLYRREYAQAGLKMLPSVDATGRMAPLSAVLHALVLLPVSLAPAIAPLQLAGWDYFATALVLGLGYLLFACLFMFRTSDSTARGLLRASLVYLPTLLICLMLDMPLA